MFWKRLAPRLKRKDRNFQNKLLDLNISVTPKVHAAFFHIEDVLTDNQVSLGFFSEQSFDSVLSDYN